MIKIVKDYLLRNPYLITQRQEKRKRIFDDRLKMFYQKDEKVIYQSLTEGFDYIRNGEIGKVVKDKGDSISAFFKDRYGVEKYYESIYKIDIIKYIK